MAKEKETVVDEESTEKTAEETVETKELLPVVDNFER